MRLRDRLNEFELDWAQAAVRSGLIEETKLKGARVLLVGGSEELRRAAAWSFLAWNEEKKTGLLVEEASLDWQSQQPRLQVTHTYTEEGFEPEQADYILLPGLCGQEIPARLEEALAIPESFQRLVKLLCQIPSRSLLLLSDGRVYGELEAAFAASEYEAGKTRLQDAAFSAQYLLQALESILICTARTSGRSYRILRTGLIYGAGIPMRPHPAYRMAKSAAKDGIIEAVPSARRASYLCIHDLLTAVQFALTACPDNKILNVKGADSDCSPAELAVMLYQNFPETCSLRLAEEEPRRSGILHGGKPGGQDEIGSLHGEEAETRTEQDAARGAQAEGLEGALLNTQLIEHYGFRPAIRMEDGLIILVKWLQNTGEVFIFDHTYLGKLTKVQQILLGYLLEIDRICRKHGIRYFLAGGTLLGAVRHHGFIPWDDDADVMMLREDYDKFLSVVQEELPENVFVQLPVTEKGNYNPFTKLRIDNTMFATEFTGHFMEMHNGIFFDVLSHDQTGNHRWSQKLHLMATMLTRSVVFNKWGDTDIKSGGSHPVICKIVDRAKYLIPMPLAVRLQNLMLELFKNRRSEYLYDGMGRNLKRGAFPKKWLEKTVYLEFEGYRFPVPGEYDRYLTYLYGDYMQMIPVSERRTSHSIVLTDLGEYSDYRLEEPGKKR